MRKPPLTWAFHSTAGGGGGGGAVMVTVGFTSSGLAYVNVGGVCAPAVAARSREQVENRRGRSFMGCANLVSVSLTVNDPRTSRSGVLQEPDERRAPLDVFSRRRFRSGQAGIGRRSRQPRGPRPEAVGGPRLPHQRPG